MTERQQAPQDSSKSWRGAPGTAFVVAFVVLVGSGAGYRHLATTIASTVGQAVPLPQPLAAFPMQVGQWRGEDVPVDENVRRIAGDDDYINRRYSSDRAHRSVKLYVGYIGRPRQWLSHRPEVCYSSQGWTQVGREECVVPTKNGEEVPALLYEFRSPEVAGPRELVLATYLINGEYRTDPAEGGGYTARSVGLFRQQAAYITRVQISVMASGQQGEDRKTLRNFTAQVMQPLAALMPNEENASGQAETKVVQQP